MLQECISVIRELAPLSHAMIYLLSTEFKVLRDLIDPVKSIVLSSIIDNLVKTLEGSVKGWES